MRKREVTHQFENDFCVKKYGKPLKTKVILLNRLVCKSYYNNELFIKASKSNTTVLSMALICDACIIMRFLNDLFSTPYSYQIERVTQLSRENKAKQKKKILNPLFQTGDVVYGEEKLRDLGIVFKPSFKCLKNKKLILVQRF